MQATEIIERTSERRIHYSLVIEGEAGSARNFTIRGSVEIPWGRDRKTWVADVQTTSYGAVSTADAINIARALTHIAELAQSTADHYNHVGLTQLAITEDNYREEDQVEL